MTLSQNPVAANDNIDFYALAERAGAERAECDLEATASQPLYVRFSSEDAKTLGFVNTRVSWDYVEYLLDGYVAPEDQAAAELLDEMFGGYFR
jgi:hypothetical protein